MVQRTYRALRVVQQPEAPPLFLTWVAATVLLEWGDVPRARGDYMAGYQRILDTSRTADLTDSATSGVSVIGATS